MNEDLHIEKAARLADKPGAENLANDRAKAFVAKALKNQKDKEVGRKSIFSRRPVYTWGGIAMAMAACVAVAIVLSRPTGDNGMVPGYGNPGTLLEDQSIHANSELLDSAKTESADSLILNL